MSLSPEIQNTIATWLTSSYDAETQAAIRTMQATGQDE
mgnify:CR=1 FL=1